MKTKIAFTLYSAAFSHSEISTLIAINADSKRKERREIAEGGLTGTYNLFH